MVTGGMPEYVKMWTEARNVGARLVHKIYRITAPDLPVAAYNDRSAFGTAPQTGATGRLPLAREIGYLPSLKVR